MAGERGKRYLSQRRLSDATDASASSPVGLRALPLHLARGHSAAGVVSVGPPDDLSSRLSSVSSLNSSSPSLSRHPSVAEVDAGLRDAASRTAEALKEEAAAAAESVRQFLKCGRWQRPTPTMRLQRQGSTVLRQLLDQQLDAPSSPHSTNVATPRPMRRPLTQRIVPADGDHPIISPKSFSARPSTIARPPMGKSTTDPTDDFVDDDEAERPNDAPPPASAPSVAADAFWSEMGEAPFSPPTPAVGSASKIPLRRGRVMTDEAQSGAFRRFHGLE